MPINQSALNVTVKLSDRSSLASSNNQPITLRGQTRTANFVSELVDVNEGSPTDGFTLVYDSTSDKYIVKQLTSSDINITSLDGGTF